MGFLTSKSMASLSEYSTMVFAPSHRYTCLALDTLPLAKIWSVMPKSKVICCPQAVTSSWLKDGPSQTRLAAGHPLRDAPAHHYRLSTGGA